jgi:hypothetical protein
MNVKPLSPAEDPSVARRDLKRRWLQQSPLAVTPVARAVTLFGIAKLDPPFTVADQPALNVGGAGASEIVAEPVRRNSTHRGLNEARSGAIAKTFS